MKARLRFGGAATLLVLGVSLFSDPRVAAAQTVVSSLTDLGALVPVGAEVAVKTADGRTITGHLRNLSASQLVFAEPGKPAISAGAIATVSRRTGHPPVVKGLVIGLVIGAAAGLGTFAVDEARTPPCRDNMFGCGRGSWPSAQAVAGLYALVGAGIGGGIGAGVGASLKPPMKIVYRAPALSRLSIAPLVTSRGRGIVFTIGF